MIMELIKLSIMTLLAHYDIVVRLKLLELHL